MINKFNSYIFFVFTISAGFSFATPSCNPIGVNNCVLPFPSNYFSVENTESPTGLTLNFSNELISDAAISQIPENEGLTVEELFNTSSGFSPNSPVIFEFIERPNEENLSNENTIVAYNVTKGTFQTIRSSVSSYARNKLLIKNTSNILEIFPVGRWDFGDTYIVAVTSNLLADDGEAIERHYDFNQLLYHTDNSSLSDVYFDGLSALSNLGFDVSDIITATVFTVRDKEEIVSPMINTALQVYENDHPVRDMKIKYKRFGSISAVITGEVRSESYRVNKTGVVDFDIEPVEEWISFLLTMPRLKKGESAPVAIYAHGISATKELSINSLSNAKLGIATIGINFPNHGDRILDDGGYVLLNVSTQEIAQQVGMLTQPTLDFMSLLKGIRSELNNMDALPKGRWTSRFKFSSRNGDGFPDLDVSNVSMQGTSLGGVLGATFAAIAPELKGAYFHVTGAGIIPILSESLLWDFLFQGLIPDGVSGAEAVMLRATLQQLIDDGDAANFIDYAKNPLPGQSARPFGILIGDGDQVVPNNSTVSMANIMDIPLVGEEFFYMQGVRRADDFEDGFGITQETIFKTGIDLFDSSQSHLFPIVTPRAWEIQESWIEKYILDK